MPIVLPTPTIGKGSGDPETILLGTSTSPPGGVESFFEYNGLVLNNRQLIDTYIITNIDGLHDADIRDSRDVNPSYHGETAFNAWYGGRTIVLTGRIRAHEIRKLRDMQDALKLSFGGLEERPLRIASNFNDHDVEIYCRKSQPLAMVEAQQNFKFERDFLLTLRASDPRFRSVIPVIQFGTRVGATFSPVDCVNFGSTRAQPLYTIVGPISNPTITNQSTGDSMNFNTNLLAGASLTINSLARTVVDNTGANKFNVLSVTSDWVELVPGTNTLELTGSGIAAGSEFNINFKHAWL